MVSSASRSRTSKTSSKKRSSLSGLSVKESLEQLNSSISLAKGLHAILYSKLLVSISPLVKVKAEHLQILSQDLMDEIWNAEAIVMELLSDSRPRLTI
jgi:hypothetical protein